VESEPSLKIQIVPKGIKKWYNIMSDRRQILCIQALPYLIKKMINIKPEQNDKSKGKNKLNIYLRENALISP
jgi:hypothetical protein